MDTETTSTHATGRRVHVTERALVQRLKRRHARDGERFHVTRVTNPRAHNADLGHWYVVEGGFVRAAWHSLEDLVTREHERGN
jgi:hypothetical protein